MPCQVRTSATPGARLRVPQAARPAQRPLPGPRFGGAGAACVLGSCLEHRATSSAVSSSDSGGAKSASWRMYSSRRRLYLSSRRCPAPVISCLAIGSPAPGRSRPAGSSTNEQTRIPRSRCTWRGSAARAAPPCSPPENGGILAAALRRRPSSIHPGTASGSAPALRHSPAAWRARGSSMLPLGRALQDPGDLGQQVARAPAASWASAATAAASHRCSAPATWHGAAPGPRWRPRVSGQPAAAYRSCVPASPVAMNYGTGAPGLLLSGRAAAEPAPGHHSTRPGPVAGRRVTLTARPHTPRAPGRTAAPGLDSSGHGVRRG